MKDSKKQINLDDIGDRDAEKAIEKWANLSKKLPDNKDKHKEQNQ